MKSAFPKWLKRPDPLLEEIERTNPIYEAFRGRREAYRQGHPYWRPLRGLASVDAIVSLVGIALVPFSCGMSLFLPLVIAPSLQGVFGRGTDRDNALPLWVDEVFSGSGSRQAAVDLWMCGASGREVLKAIYADVRERQWPPCVLPAVFVVCLFLVGVVNNVRGPLETAIAVPVAVYASFAFMRLVQSGAMQYVFDRQIRRALFAWSDPFLPWNEIGRGTYYAIVIGFFSFCCCGAPLSSLFREDMMLDLLSMETDTLGIPARFTIVLVSTVTATAAGLVHFLTIFWRSKLQHDLAAAFAAADSHYADFMRRWLCRDLEQEPYDYPDDPEEES